MSTVFLPPDPRTAMSGDPMSSATKPKTNPLINSPVSAANADKLGETTSVEIKSIEATGGWDAYEVWRRFIKDARAKRLHGDPN
jgi:hypothetical protein